MIRFKINIIGRGNVATHLYRAFKDIPCVAAAVINPHTLENIDSQADFTIIAVSDNAIADVADRLPPLDSIVVHTSGATPLCALSQLKRAYGVLYPLQTFSKNKDMEYNEIPFFIEGSDPCTEEKLIELGNLISTRVYKANSEQRKALHVSGVFACNFVNHLWVIADKILKENGMDFDILHPLLKETLRKTVYIPPFDGQTGPAIRKDTKTMQAHIEFLRNSDIGDDAIDIYELLSQSIIAAHDNTSSK